MPDTVRTNADLAQAYPETLREIESHLVFRQTPCAPSTTEWDLEIAAYLGDPFRGTVERRVLAADEAPRDLQRRAAIECLQAAETELDEVDLMIVTSVFAQQPGPGDAAYLGESLGMSAPAINIESACAGTLVSLQVADALVTAGQHRRILIVASCAYSRIADPADSLAWWLGDGAGALLIEPARTPAEGITSTGLVDTFATCNSFYCELESNEGLARVRMKSGRNVGAKYATTNADYLRRATAQALNRAGIGLHDIDFFVVNTPLAWYADFICRVLGVDRARTIDLYPRYANIGPVLPIASAVHASALGLIAPGDQVLLYSIGSTATAAAVVVEWGDVAVAPIRDALAVAG